MLRDVLVASNVAAGGVDVHGNCANGSGGLVDGVRIVNNTVVTGDVSLPGVRAEANPDGSSGGDIRGLEIANSILQTPGPNLAGEIAPGQVHDSLVADAAFLGRDGNLAGDPRFVDAGAGDFHLRSDSPAIDRGASDVAPRLDADGRGRVDDPGVPNLGSGPLPFVDLGAYEQVPAAGGAPCAPGPNALCLGSGRFRVEADWETAAGASGEGRGVPLTADTGYVWFFVETNVEVVIKVLDACSLNQRYWTFAAGLTDVESRLTVTDTLTGRAREYRNTQGTPFPPIQDTDAFATCASP